MPIYEYSCKNCGHSLDALQKINDERLVDCPECDQPKLIRLLSAPRFRLKGKGWYETDFKTDNKKNVYKSDSESQKSDKTTKDSGKKEKDSKKPVKKKNKEGSV